MNFGEDILLKTIGRLYVINQLQVNTIEQAERMLKEKEGELGELTEQISKAANLTAEHEKQITELVAKLDKAKPKRKGRDK